MPVTLVRSAALGETSTCVEAAGIERRLPCTVSVPIELPGASVPPPAIVVAADSAGAAERAARVHRGARSAMEPFTLSVPPFTVVAPV